MEGNVRMFRAKIQSGEMTEQEAEAMLGKSVWEAQGKIPASWPTPTASDYIERKSTQQTPGSMHSVSLPDAVRMWPTPTVDDANNVNPKANRFHGLVAEVNHYPTPTYGKLAGGTGGFNQIEELYLSEQITLEEKKAMQAGNGGKLNPMWVEWLMGFPPGWTDLEDLETL
jgi:DNA (cytosine-5)-methyltransferase 1